VTEFRGRLKALSCADVLEFLRVLNRRGLLSLATEGASIGLYLREDRMVHATSSRSGDRLSEIMVQGGLITPSQCEDAMRRAASGETIGRALLLAGGLSPRTLMEARRRQVRQIAVSPFEWEDGAFAFHEGEAPPDAEVEVDLPITEVLLEGIRSIRNLALFRKRLPFDDWVFEPIPDGAAPLAALEAHEEYVLRLVDGARSLGRVAAESEFGPAETLRTVFLLFVLGRLKKRPQAPDDAAPDGFEGIVERYNGMFGMVYQHLMREIGPISEHLLERSLREMTAAHPELFHSTSLGGDGTVDGGRLRENLGSLERTRRRDTLVQGLNELLYSELLVLRKTLGSEHEGRILRAFKDARLREPEAGA